MPFPAQQSPKEKIKFSADPIWTVITSQPAQCRFLLQAALALGISLRNPNRHLAFARALLYNRLSNHVNTSS
jgi:hypothetical protein